MGGRRQRHMMEGRERGRRQRHMMEGREREGGDRGT